MTTSSAPRPLVVVIDDEPEIRAILAEFLRYHGYEPLVAANGLEGLLQIKHHRPVAVTLDLRMPRLGGLDAIPRIGKFDPSIRIIVLTGDLDEATHQRALAAGASAVVTKPLVLTTLLAAVRGEAVRSNATASP